MVLVKLYVCLIISGKDSFGDGWNSVNDKNVVNNSKEKNNFGEWCPPG